MKKFLSYSFVVAAIAFGVVGGTTTAASAAHCQNTEMTSPGFSYFGNDHVKEATHAEGGNPGPHAGTSGASNCRDTTGSPSTRAPGRS
ncbi:hypothetical protein E3T55_16255 [Cryobacterium frigoriphilum]|uniref:Adenylate cyclase n=1 Tax=Cryobacterium frigoriphilum TaxID=1259150 RepID=A0A4R8ZUV6_9MICO|nr:hypothetical protein [Cryobacterium frigoriphilum]TFD46925.1 hypothetical protein E3T55_16255 [Cryobacterium frigoriphilum]